MCLRFFLFIVYSLWFIVIQVHPPGKRNYPEVSNKRTINYKPETINRLLPYTASFHKQNHTSPKENLPTFNFLAKNPKKIFVFAVLAK